MAALGGGDGHSYGGWGKYQTAFPCSHARRQRDPSSPATIKAPANFNQSRLWKPAVGCESPALQGMEEVVVELGAMCVCVCVCACVRACTPVCIISPCPEPWRSRNTSVAQARFIKNPGYRPAVKIEAAYLLHFVQINLKTCESYSLERWGEEVNNIRLILTSRGGHRTKMQKVPPQQGLCALHALRSWGLGEPYSPATVPVGPNLALVSSRTGSLPSAPGFSVVPWFIASRHCGCHLAFWWQLQKLDSIMDFSNRVCKGTSSSP